MTIQRLKNIFEYNPYLYDKRIVSYKIGDSNNNSLVFETFDEAVKANPNTYSLFHSGREFSTQAKSFKAN